VLYRCLVGEVPFPRPTGQSRCWHISTICPRARAPSDPGCRRASTPSFLNALEKDPQRRPRSASALVGRLASALSSSGPSIALRSKREPAAYPPVRSRRAPLIPVLPYQELPPAPPLRNDPTVLRHRVGAHDAEPPRRPLRSRSTSGLPAVAWMAGLGAAILVIVVAVVVLTGAKSSDDGNAVTQSNLRALSLTLTRRERLTKSARSFMGWPMVAELTVHLAAIDRSVANAGRLRQATLRMLPEGDPARRLLIDAQHLDAQTAIKPRDVAQTPGASGSVSAVTAARTAYEGMLGRLVKTTY